MEDEESGPAKQIGKLIGVDPDLLIDNFVQPKIKVKILMVVINDQSKGTMRCHELAKFQTQCQIQKYKHKTTSPRWGLSG